MTKITLSESAARAIKSHYQRELATAIAHVNELKQVLSELSQVDVQDTNSFSYVTPTANFHEENFETPDFQNHETDSASDENVKARKSNAGRKKKRGRKATWQNFIISRLRATNQPLTYDEMSNHAIAIHKLDKGEFERTRAKIIAAAFNLRTKQDKIDNYAIKGSRVKYMGLKDWFEREGKLKQEWRDKLN